MKKLFWLICILASTLSFVACDSPDELTGDDELAVDEVEQNLSTSYLWKGNLTYDTIKSETLTNTALFENVHQYRFIALANQTVTFVLDIPTSASGAWLSMTSGSTYSLATTLRSAKSTTATRVEFVHTFASAQTVYLWVRQATPAIGSFAYKLSTQRARCATMGGSIYDNYWIPSTGTWTMMAAKYFPAGSTENPSTWTPSYDGGTFSTSTRVVMLGTCTANKAPSCGTTGPAVCESDYTFLGQSMVDNACAAKNLILERADNVTPDSWIGWWKAMTQCPG